MQISNQTDFAVDNNLVLDMDGRENLVTVINATFDLTEDGLEVSDNQEPVFLINQHHSDPVQSSLAYQEEFAFDKPGTDVVLNGHVYHPDGEGLWCDVAVRVAQQHKIVRVFGDRTWEPGLGKLEISAPKPFRKIPLLFEHAYGGTVRDAQNNTIFHPSNPLGLGFGLSRDTLTGARLPNLENPATLIRSWKDQPAPACFGFVSHHWQPRVSLTGTMDEAWEKSRMPLLPLDFDNRYFMGGPQELQMIPHMNGGEEIEIINAAAQGRLVFRVPKIHLGLLTRIKRGEKAHRPQLATLIIEPDKKRVILVYTSVLPCHRQRYDIKETVVFFKDER
jgi:hypothetical protein